ncbi:O-glucosyltransferase rumi homolog [Impatiens glandulifera]|uniref:O-glucosyltransferase rumi homolog n=1 Tax=Impatiens glandulifera TaxID=253017 RepID=UPI001FB1071C|nr:O-glucosyltransferase rumi homolog [Impatiens glandulifera]
MVEKGKEIAHMRIILLNGKLYVHKYKQAFQTRDVFSLWGILQLLRLYPGKLSDLDIMFQFGDRTTVLKSDYTGGATPPPVFHYCGDDSTYDIVFPDWSFWGWSEINIEPWVALSKELEEGSSRLKWIEREPYAYWKGNAQVNQLRQDLTDCDVTKGKEWNARIHNLDWDEANKHGFSDTKLADQCNYRYKVYAEGAAWPRYYDFFSRDLLPMVHYWPINQTNMCRSIKYAVDWGNNHTKEAQAIGKAASEYIQEQVKMTNVYDYMFHLLSEYGKLLKYKPTVPEGAVEMCLEKIVCDETGLDKKFKIESMVNRPMNRNPCDMPMNLSPDLEGHVKKKQKLIKQVEIWEESGKI